MFDPVKTLTDWGWSEEDAQTIVDSLSGSDFLDLVILLKSKDFSKVQDGINSLLKSNNLPTLESRAMTVKPRNPFIQNLVNKKAGSHDDKSVKRDSYSRKAKHKKSPEDSIEDNDMPKFNEEINRLRKLSGLNEASDEELQNALEPINVADSDMDLDLGDSETDLPLDDTDLDTTLDADPELDMEPEMGLEEPELPSEVPQDNMMDTPTKSVAYSLIEEKLNSVQEMLGEINLSEYKMLVARLSELASQIRIKGTEYLGESRKRK